MQGRLRLTALGAVAAAVLGAGGAGAAPPAPTGYVTTGDCAEHQAFVQGDAGAVAARLPRRYTAELDPSSGAPLVFVRALRCSDLDADGQSGPATVASYGVVVESPDGSGCASSAPGVGSAKGDFPPLCNWYTLAWLADRPRVVDWLRRGTEAFPAFQTAGLVFKLGGVDPAQGGAPLHVEAPAPWSFSMDEVGRARPGQLSVRGSYFNDTPDGTVRLRFSSPDLTSGDADGTVRAAAGSELAKLMGATERPYLASASALSAEHWDHASYRKQLERANAPTDGFAGSCSLQGTSAFSPPAGYVDAALTYDYTATGTCTGTLNGAKLDAAPVRMHHTGAAFGGCQRAVTTSPGRGTLTFPDGTAIDYTLDFSFAGTEGDFEFYGARAGFGTGHGTFVTDRTPPDVAASCAGQNVQKTPLDITLSTKTPLVSAAPPPGARGAPGAAPRVRSRHPRMLVSVRPRRVRQGSRRGALVVRVRNAEGRPVPGAAVRLGPRRARTRADGRARLVTALRYAGRWRVRASEPGFARASTPIVVRRARSARAPAARRARSAASR